LNEPEPSQETGPGSYFRPASVDSKPAPERTPTRLSRNPYRKGSVNSKSPTTTRTEKSSPAQNTSGSYPSPPPSASPRQEQFPRLSPNHRQEAFAEHAPTVPSKDSTTTKTRRRGSSLTSRFPGDRSHHPLAQLTAENKAANRSPHLHKKHHIGPDQIDVLDTVGNGYAYHHEGPYDATMFARNNSGDLLSSKSSPIGALMDSNAEALKATPKEKIQDSLGRHRPLDGVAAYPPGVEDPTGHVYNYNQGENMMIENGPEGGAYKRWPGVRYHPDDVKGVGEPSFSIERALKEHKIDDSAPNPRRMPGTADGIEMSTRNRSGSGTSRFGKDRTDSNLSQDNSTVDPRNPMWGDGEQGRFSPRVGRSASGREKRMSGGGLKRRFGSLKKRIGDAQILP
jgi:hypothetical protein